MNVRITTDTITPELQRILRRVSGPEARAALKDAAKAVEYSAKDAFEDDSRRPAPWAPLSPITIARKGGSKPLIASGDMRRSIRVISVGPKQALIGSHSKAGKYSLAAIHQLGAPKARIPARPFFPFSSSGQATEEIKREVRGIIIRMVGFK